jgi:chemotaxis protein CheX
MQAKYINPFLNAAINLFQEYLGIPLKHKPPFVNNDTQNLNEVSAIIGLAGETIGAVVLSFDRNTAVRIISKLSGIPYQALSNEVIDGVGELVNIIAGNAKKDLKDFRIDVSLPGVITGNRYKINWPKDIPVITIPFESSFGNFTVNVSLKDMDPSDVLQ